MNVDFHLQAPENLAGTLELPAQGGWRQSACRRLRPDHGHALRSPSTGAHHRAESREGVVWSYRYGARISNGRRMTVSDLLDSHGIATVAPSLVEAAWCFGGQMARNADTVAGNIACRSPAADLVQPLISLDVTVTLVPASHALLICAGVGEMDGGRATIL